MCSATLLSSSASANLPCARKEGDQYYQARLHCLSENVQKMAELNVKLLIGQQTTPRPDEVSRSAALALCT